ncbi:hypothetical protein [Streptomyces sp. SID13726]|uniref:hypothetical protein n=1 Tax=Streptomyces sp. SID13726 TaxID=2706058 RepID=UPI0013BA9F2E|nr:hypothetical protein [Streptomyces sp. SID13726]NEA98864.1 hypothetical protein [Streptomyces sp. SID13726]
MVRVSYDYDLMTELARDIWHLRDELDVTSHSDHAFSASAVGPRRETAEALTDFYGAWQKSFREAWQVMTDLGNLLDQAGKAFYDQDAANAAGAAQQNAAFVREEARSQNQAYQDKLDAARRETKAQDLDARYRTQQARLQKQQDGLRRKQDLIDQERAAQDKRQEALDRQNQELRERQEPLEKHQRELQQRQQELWAQEKELRDRRDAMLQQKQDQLQKEYDDLRKEQEPLQQRYADLQHRQQELWADEKALRDRQDQENQARTAELEKEQKAYEAKQDALQRRQDELLLERRALIAGGHASPADLDAWQRRQDALTRERDDLSETEGEPLQRGWDALEQQQRDNQKAFGPLQRRQEDLDAERTALEGDQKPLATRQDELQKQQHSLWDLEKTSQRELDDRVGAAQQRLDLEREALDHEQEPLDRESDDLQDRQQTLWQDQARTEDEQAALQKEEEPLRRQQDDLQQNYAEQREELRNYTYDPASGEGDPLMRRRDLADEFSDQPAPEPKGLTWENAESTTTVSYKLDANGDVAVDKDGNPVETTTTITNKATGLTYSETYHQLSPDGDSVTTTHSSDGSVTRSYVDASPEDRTDGTMVRYVTDEHGDTQQIYTKAPGGDWQLTMDKDTYLDSEAGKEDDQQFLDRPPAYLTVENPVVDSGGHPSGDPSAPGTTTALQDGVTRTDYTAPDGSPLKVVTNENTGVRYVAGANNEIQEVWQRGQNGSWYLRDSVTQHERYGDEPPLGSLGENWA